jgi:NTP pyrophosphatase (non-canonical NTP hydrolase)
MGKKMMLNKLGKKIMAWREKKGFITGWKNMPEKLMLVVTELSEAMEAYRHDDKKNFNEEISDCFIRLLDICGSLNINIEDEIKKKMEVNKQRPFKHGKKC